jgi:hypothetical protein
MAVFVSHSSADKQFVRRLAADLLAEGLPVWLDQWELDLGDSLVDRIHSAINSSDSFLLVISKASNESGWVREEVQAALKREAELGRRLLIPVLIDTSAPPSEVADRFYANFSKAYLPALEDLARRLLETSKGGATADTERMLLPLTFLAGPQLDTVAFRKRLNYLRALLPPGFQFRPKNLFVLDEEFTVLKRRITERRERLKEDSFYTPEFAVEFSDLYHEVTKQESQLLEGICLLLNNLALTGQTQFDPVAVCKWFTLIWRSSNLYSWWSLQHPDRECLIDYGRECIRDPSGGDAHFYGVERTGALDIGPSPNGLYLMDSFRVRVDVNEPMYLSTSLDGYLLLARVLDYGASVVETYVFPQMLAGMLRGIKGPHTWTLERYFCGRA